MKKQPKEKPIILKDPPTLSGADDRNLPRYLTIKEMAKFVNVSQAKIRLDLTKGRLKRYKYGQRTLIRLDDALSQIREV
jgi:excisionase family DNA binding protein